MKIDGNLNRNELILGKAKIGHIYKDKLVEKELETGDIYRIGAGFPFYINNTAEGQRLHIICSIDTLDSLGLQPFQVDFSILIKYALL